jgi:hypothetical protein
MRLVGLLLAVGCGDNLSVADGGVDAASGCIATFAGNFDETTTSLANCPTTGGMDVAFSVPSVTLDAPLAITIALGRPLVTGLYSSATVQSWSAVATSTSGSGRSCVYRAGSSVVPHGNFTLNIRALDPAPHGVLDVVQFVLVPPFTDCGRSTTESVELSF